MQALGNAAILERPFHPTSLVSLVKSAIRGRRRQYEARARLEMLADLNATLEARVDAAIAEHKVLADIVESTDAFVQVVDLGFRFIAINRASVKEFEGIYGVRPRVGDSMLELLKHKPGRASHRRDGLVPRPGGRAVHRDRSAIPSASSATTR